MIVAFLALEAINNLNRQVRQARQDRQKPPMQLPGVLGDLGGLIHFDGRSK
jgi:hypothetical protein